MFQLFFAYVAGFVELVEYFEVVDQLGNVVEGVGPDFLRTDIFKNSFGLFRIRPEIGLLRDQFFVFYFKALTIVVKDTSSRR